MFGFFKRKKEVEELREEVSHSFANVKKDFSKVSKWIGYIDKNTSSQKKDLEFIRDSIHALQEDVSRLNEVVSIFNSGVKTEEFKQAPTTINKQAMPKAVQTVVQTPVQTINLDNLTVMERAIVWALLNSEMRLSYEDIAALLGKEKSTVRGQINSIKQKIPSLIGESRELNGKKRLYVPEEIAIELMQGLKVAKKRKKGKSESYDDEN